MVDERSLARALERVVAARVREQAASASLAGLRVTDLQALELIVGPASTTPRELSERLSLSSGGTAAVIDRLAAAGLVRRAPGDGGRRRVTVVAGERSRALVARRRVALAAELQVLLDELSAGDRHALQRGLERLAELTDRLADRAESEAAATVDPAIPDPPRWG